MTKLTRDWKQTIDERCASDAEFKQSLPVGIVYSMQDGYIGQMIVKGVPHMTKLYTQPHQRQARASQPAQEPMAWMNDEGFGLYPTNDSAIPLYTQPHQWNGLSDAEIDRLDEIVDDQLLLDNFSITDYIHAFARAIEQKLKEKNHD